jgi:hypothetical protein
MSSTIQRTKKFRLDSTKESIEALTSFIGIVPDSLLFYETSGRKAGCLMSIFYFISSPKSLAKAAPEGGLS